MAYHTGDDLDFIVWLLFNICISSSFINKLGSSRHELSQIQPQLGATKRNLGSKILAS